MITTGRSHSVRTVSSGKGRYKLCENLALTRWRCRRLLLHPRRSQHIPIKARPIGGAVRSTASQASRIAVGINRCGRLRCRRQFMVRRAALHTRLVERAEGTSPGSLQVALGDFSWTPRQSLSPCSSTKYQMKSGSLKHHTGRPTLCLIANV